jgi:competence protein ComEC
MGSRLLPSRTSFTIRATEVTLDELSYRLRVPVRVLSESAPPLYPGEEIRFTGRIAKSRELDVAALVITSGEIERLSTAGPIRSGLEKLRIKFRQRAAQLGGDAGALLPGLALGDTSLQTLEFESVMRRAGLSHLTAVSGANFAIVSAFIFAIVGWFVPRLSIQITIASATLILFIILVRPTPSVLRAAVMAAIFLLARASGRRRQAASALAVAVATLLLLNPFQAFEPGFILSVSATAGLIFLAPRLEVSLARALPSWLAEILAVAAAASICCTPYLLYLSESVGAGTVLSNVLVAPAIPIVTILVFLAALVVIPLPIVSDFLLWLAHFGAAWIVQVANWNREVLQISTSPTLVLLFIALAALYWRVRRRWVMALALALILLVTSARLAFPGSNWRVGQCDVGQGDALLVNLGNGAAALFDAGPQPALLERCLELFRVTELALVVISHRHADHYAGFSGIGDRLVGELWVNGGSDTYAVRNIREITEGVVGRVGGLVIKSLWPRATEPRFGAIAGDGSQENNRSIVLALELDGVHILVTGDIEPGAQELIAQSADLSDIEILKVPHHGSRFQAEPFLSEVRPAVSLISVGENSYGHPDAELIAPLSELGSKVFRTDHDGAIALSWRADEGKPIFSARKLGKEWWRISWR